MKTTIPAQGNGRRNAPHNGGEKPRWESTQHLPLDYGTGRYDKLAPLTPEEAEELHLWVSRSGWRIGRQKVAHYVIDVMATHEGRRFQISGASIGHAVGLSDSKARYHLRKLEEIGFLRRYRDHAVHTEVTGDGEIRYWGIPAVRQLSSRVSAGQAPDGSDNT